MKRIGRSLTDEVFPHAKRPRFRYTIKAETADELLEIQYKRSNWFRLLEDGEVRERIIEGLILVEGGHAGSFELAEYEVGPLTDGVQFLDEMDGHSQAAAHLAETIVQHWEEPCELFDRGNVVELRRLWMAPGLSGKGRLEAAMEALLASEFNQRSLTILKAFPLEYEGRIDEITVAAFKLRQSAMMRLYSRLLKVAPLPGTSGDEGWMFAIPDRLRKCHLEPAEDVDWMLDDDEE